MRLTKNLPYAQQFVVSNEIRIMAQRNRREDPLKGTNTHHL